MALDSYAAESGPPDASLADEESKEPLEDKERIELTFLSYNREDFLEISEQYKNGERKVNVSATGSVFAVFVKTMHEMVEQL